MRKILQSKAGPHSKHITLHTVGSAVSCNGVLLITRSRGDILGLFPINGVIPFALQTSQRPEVTVVDLEEAAVLGL
jgi:hypothetical protein